MMKSPIRIVVLCATTLLVAFGDNWPPREMAFKHHFETHRNSYVQLEEKLRASDYKSVSKYLGDTHGIHVKLIGEEDLVVAEDTDGWRELLLASNTFTVYLKDDEFRALVIMSHDKSNRITSAFYSHGDKFLSKLPKCVPEHESVRCGQCYVALGEQWGLAYEWWPAVMLPEAQEKNRAGELSGTEYYDLFEAAVSSCWREGSDEMGFEIPLE